MTGGFDLGFERAGFETKWQVEIDPFCNKILERHFPKAKRYGDITKLDPAELEWVDVITGGFPCQPHSVAGKRKGEDDHRDLWSECVRMLRGIRPRWAVFENVPGLLVSNGGAFFNRVLTDIHEGGYDAEWQTISAADVGAPHLRKRLWLVAYPQSQRNRPLFDGEGDSRVQHHSTGRARMGGESRNGGEDVGNAESHRRQHAVNAAGEKNKDGQKNGKTTSGDRLRLGNGGGEHNGWWAVEPDVGRVANGVPDRVDRLRSLGNAIVPQVAEWIAKRIIEYEANP